MGRATDCFVGKSVDEAHLHEGFGAALAQYEIFFAVVEFDRIVPEPNLILFVIQQFNRQNVLSRFIHRVPRKAVDRLDDASGKLSSRIAMDVRDAHGSRF